MSEIIWLKMWYANSYAIKEKYIYFNLSKILKFQNDWTIVVDDMDDGWIYLESKTSSHYFHCMYPIDALPGFAAVLGRTTSLKQ